MLASFQTEMIDRTIKETSNNMPLKQEFTKLFDLQSTENQVITNFMYVYSCNVSRYGHVITVDIKTIQFQVKAFSQFHD